MAGFQENGQMPYNLLLRELQRDPARPFVTFYDDATGERVELSVATFENWVAKTAGLMRDGLGVDSGSRVAIDLPAHWQALVWAMACWATGAEAVLGVAGVAGKNDADIAVTGPDLENTDAPDVVALALRPLGGRFTTGLPDDVLDYAVEVPLYPDRFGPFLPPKPDDPALTDSESTQTFSELVRTAQQRAADLRLNSEARVLVAAENLSTAIADALLLPLVTGGSAVLVRNEAAESRPGRVAAERVHHAL
jgi:uncharacterized protein (TIGR03089 family)